jgi:hypothetical protein
MASCPCACLRTRAVGVITVRHRVRFMKTRGKKRQSSFTTLHGILLTLAIGTFFALAFVLVYYVEGKMQNALQ